MSWATWSLLSIHLVTTPPETPLIFSHANHVQVDEKMRCVTCHLSEGAGTRLDRKACLRCHEEALEYRLPAKFERLEKPFPHMEHAAPGRRPCITCHRATIDGTLVAGEPALAPERCDACHQELKTRAPRTPCQKCHLRDKRGIPPRSHRGHWLDGHGDAAQWRALQEHASDCAACHGTDACTSCHRQRAPRSHTALWRVRTHGSAAAWDRDSCSQCHETGQCIRCHQTSQPPNHLGAWESLHGLVANTRDNPSCLACHSVRYCVECHEQNLP